MKITRKFLLLTIVPIFIIGIIVCLYFILREKPIISSPYTVSEVNRTVTVNGTTFDFTTPSGNWVALLDASYKGEDITYKIDANNFIKLLSTYKCKRTFKTYSPYSASDVTWEINLVLNYKPVHILLGNFNIWYESANKGYYKILDADSLKQCLEKLISQN
jgi:hypothetical protein